MSRHRTLPDTHDPDNRRRRCRRRLAPHSLVSSSVLPLSARRRHRRRSHPRVDVVPRRTAAQLSASKLRARTDSPCEALYVRVYVHLDRLISAGMR